MRFLMLLLVLPFVGCVNLEKELSKLPNTSFEKFTYSRTGNVTSATITATNAVKKNGTLTVENFHFVASYPIVSFEIQLDGLKLNVEEEDDENEGVER